MNISNRKLELFKILLSHFNIAENTRLFNTIVLGIEEIEKNFEISLKENDVVLVSNYIYRKFPNNHDIPNDEKLTPELKQVAKIILDTLNVLHIKTTVTQILKELSDEYRAEIFNENREFIYSWMEDTRNE